ncbi:MAG: hypothetical protein H6719_35620 [Sandaracinaceae bacterium]|nr:hypothetical protein [Sandaracinaceae bacterium]
MNRSLALVSALALLAACGEPLQPLRPAPRPPEPFACDPAATPPAVESLQWKRVAAFTADLEGALELTGDTLCREIDRIDCEAVHLVALGGNDALGAAQYTVVASPLATTPAAVDRVVLSACENAVARDAAGAPRVFTDLPPTDAPADAALAERQAAALYRRLLARDAAPDELAILAELTVDPAGAPRSAREVDVLTCFSIGTTAEMVLF